MWESSLSDENLCVLLNFLMSQLETIGGMDGDKSLGALHEYLEMTNRQIKWVIKRQKIYDFFSLSWALATLGRRLYAFLGACASGTQTAPESIR